MVNKPWRMKSNRKQQRRYSQVRSIVKFNLTSQDLKPKQDGMGKS
jgi:hypothetical protein